MASRPVAPAPPLGPGHYTVKRGDTLYRIAMENGQDYRDVAAWNNIANPSAIKEGQVLRVSPPTAQSASEGVTTAPVATANAVEARSLDAPLMAAKTNGQSGNMPIANGQAGNSTLLKREPRVGKLPYSDEAYARLSRPEEAVASAAQPARASEPVAESKLATPAAPQPTLPVAAPPPGPDEVAWQWPGTGRVLAPFSESGNKGLDIAGKAGDPVLAAAEGKVVYAGSGLRGYGELVIVKHNAVYLSAYAHNRKILVKEGQPVTRGQKIAEMGNTDADAVKLHFEIRKAGKPVDPSQYLPKR